LPEALARQVTEKAEGNPLFAEEIVSYLTERGSIRNTVEFDAIGNEKLSLQSMLRNFPILAKTKISGSVSIRALASRVLMNPHFDPSGQFIGRANMILGLLHKIKKKRAPAIQHLTEAQRILSQFGQTPILARVETALAELAQ
jgi:hypothetical protein